MVRRKEERVTDDGSRPPRSFRAASVVPALAGHAPPAVAASPALANGFVSFGYFDRTVRLNGAGIVADAERRGRSRRRQ
jgi:hypothetical protein